MNIEEIIWGLLGPAEITPEFEALHKQIETAKADGTLTDKLLNKCDNAECLVCGSIVCPHHEPLHFHHDGCPACDL